MKTGDYVINFYNKFGKCLKELRLEHDEGVIQAETRAVAVLAKEHSTDEHFVPVSYTVDRRIVNSLDQHPVGGIS